MSVSCRHTEARPTALALQAVAADGTFEGYASLFEREDLGHDVVARGAFRDTLRLRGAARIRMLYQHDPAEPIGVWESLVEDTRGLLARGRLALSVARAREVLALMRAGAIDGLSIGFKTVTARRDPVRSVRRIERIDLWEISVVTFPMQPEARVFAVSPDRPGLIDTARSRTLFDASKRARLPSGRHGALARIAAIAANASISARAANHKEHH